MHRVRDLTCDKITLTCWNFRISGHISYAIKEGFHRYSHKWQWVYGQHDHYIGMALDKDLYGMYKQQNVEFRPCVLGLHDCFDRDY